MILCAWTSRWTSRWIRPRSRSPAQRLWPEHPVASDLRSARGGRQDRRRPARRREDPGARTTSELGLSLSSDIDGRSTSTCASACCGRRSTTPAANALPAATGRETGVLAEYYQPFGRAATTSSSPAEVPSSRSTSSMTTATRPASTTPTVGVNLAPGGSSATTAPCWWACGDTPGKRKCRSATRLPDFDFEIGEAYVEASLDRLDSAYLPRQGCCAAQLHALARAAGRRQRVRATRHRRISAGNSASTRPGRPALPLDHDRHRADPEPVPAGRFFAPGRLPAE